MKQPFREPGMINGARKQGRSSCAIVGSNLKLALKEAGITKYRLAKDLGLSYRIVQYWEKGQKPSKENAERVMAYLGITIPDSLEDKIKNHEERLSRLEKAAGMEGK